MEHNNDLASKNKPKGLSALEELKAKRISK